jgi:hypothetical protein
MSGTERQSVTNDYSLRMSESMEEVEVGVQKSLQRILRTSTELFQCNCNRLGATNVRHHTHTVIPATPARSVTTGWAAAKTACTCAYSARLGSARLGCAVLCSAGLGLLRRAASQCLNVSMCARTAAANELTVIVWNPIASDVPSQLIRIPVNGTAWTVYDANNATVPAQASPPPAPPLPPPVPSRTHAPTCACTDANVHACPCTDIRTRPADMETVWSVRW